MKVIVKLNYYEWTKWETKHFFGLITKKHAESKCHRYFKCVDVPEVVIEQKLNIEINPFCFSQEIKGIHFDIDTKSYQVFLGKRNNTICHTEDEGKKQGYVRMESLEKAGWLIQ